MPEHTTADDQLKHTWDQCSCPNYAILINSSYLSVRLSLIRFFITFTNCYDVFKFFFFTSITRLKAFKSMHHVCLYNLPVFFFFWYSFLRPTSFVICLFHYIACRVLENHISNAVISFFSCVFIVNVSKTYNSICFIWQTNFFS